MYMQCCGSSHPLVLVMAGMRDEPSILTLIWHTCDKFKMGIREVYFSFQGGFSKMYIIYGKIVNSFITASIKLAPLQV